MLFTVILYGVKKRRVVSISPCPKPLLDANGEGFYNNAYKCLFLQISHNYRLFRDLPHQEGACSRNPAFPYHATGTGRLRLIVRCRANDSASGIPTHPNRHANGIPGWVMPGRDTSARTTMLDNNRSGPDAGDERFLEGRGKGGGARGDCV